MQQREVLSQKKEEQEQPLEALILKVFFKEKIIKDVRKWSQEFLEIPNKHLGGIPACPFAKKSWNDNKVIVEIKRKFKQYKSDECLQDKFQNIVILFFTQLKSFLQE